MSNEIRGLYEFEDFRLDPETNTLWREDELISLSPKAFELLKLLVTSRGSIVSKKKIFKTVWADTYVEKGVLTQNIYTLRNVLGKSADDKHIIENIARRGYRISVPVRVTDKRTGREITEDPAAAGEGSFLKRNGIRTGIVAAVVLLLVSGFFLYKFVNGRKAEEPASNGFENLEFRRLTDKGDVNFLNISPDGNWLAYSNGEGIFLKDVQTNSEIRLEVENFGDFGFLQFSNDGNSIYFRSPEASFIPAGVYQTGRLGGVARIVAENVWSGFSFSPDGGRMAFVRVEPAENRHTLIVKDLKTGSERSFTSKTPPLEFYARNFPAWSNDGRKIASVVITRTEHFAGLVVTDTQTGKDEEIKTKQFQNVEQIVWSRDGRSLIAAASDGKNFQLWKIEYPSGKATRITNDLNDYLGISMTADGRRILARQRRYFSNIWVGDGRDPESFKQLTEGFARNEGLKGLNWTADGKLVYTANYEKLRDWNLWMLDPSDRSRRQLTNDRDAQNEYPVVSPDGKEVFYNSVQGKSAADLRRVRVADGAVAPVTSEKNESELFPQVSPDGERLYYIQKGKNSSTVRQTSLADGRTEKLTDEKELSPSSFLSLSPDGRYLAFQNLVEEKAGERSKGSFKVCVISTEDRSEKRFYDISSFQPFAYFSPDGKALEFVTNKPEGATVWRRELEPAEAEPKPLLTFGKEWIFTLAWSPDGEKLAVARGNLIRDAVVLTGFE